MSKTPHRAIRIEDPLWQAGKTKATDEGTNISAKIRRWMRQDLGWKDEEDTMKDRDDLPVEGRPRSHLPEQ